ncbi:MAG TPA: efflux RND transporter periplasmic adaptor subunit [bacterium]|mgnify:CR=1 FL=1|nr:efflux RND transporter periplasmic adaptor subunit [bacterium]HQI48511.1 efflux RND transporter periplasmic adaptor subunit [bacterium]HQJ63066.1 efflux RND transporter periplasmic adaptor subunit [bacterium]
MRTGILSIAALGLLFLAGCDSENKGGAEQGEAVNPAKAVEQSTPANRVILHPASIREIGLEVVEVRESLIAGSVTAPAVLTASQDFEALVGTLVPGRVSRVFVRLGDHVRKGEPLMEIEGLEIGEIKARYIQAKAQHDFAAANLERQKILAGENIGSRKSLQEAQAAYDQALAGFEAEDRRIHSAGLSDAEVLGSSENNPGTDHTAGTLVIRSPIDGTIVERNVVIGQPVDEAATAFRVLNNAVLWADGHLFEKDIAGLAGKPEVTITTTAYPGERFTGRITYIGAVVDPQTRSVQIRAEIRNPDLRLKSGMFAEMTIPVHTAHKGLVVPAESLLREQGATFLFVARDDTTFELLQVEPGISSGEAVEILRGLQAGERVAGKGSFYLKSEWKKGEFAEEE